MSEERILSELAQIRLTLSRLQKDLDLVKKAVITEAAFEEESLELDKEMKDLNTEPELVNEVRYKEETLDEVEKELGG